MRIGTVIVSLREHRDVRQEALAHLSGVSWRSLQRMESGTTNVGLDAYIKVAQALRVPLTRLFDDSESYSRGGAEPVANPGAQGGEPEVAGAPGAPEHAPE